MLFKTEGIVLRATNNLKNDVILSVLTKEYGRLDVKGFGARSLKSKIFAASKPLITSFMEIEKKGNYYTLKSADIVSKRHAILEDYDILMISQYILEIANKYTRYNGGDEHFYLLINYILDLLENHREIESLFYNTQENKNVDSKEYRHTGDDAQIINGSRERANFIEVIRATYLLKLVDIAGIRPEIKIGDTYFFPNQGISGDSNLNSKEAGIKVGRKWFAIVCHFFDNPIIHIIEKKVPQRYVKHITDTFEEYLFRHLDFSPLNTTNML